MENKTFTLEEVISLCKKSFELGDENCAFFNVYGEGEPPMSLNQFIFNNFGILPDMELKLLESISDDEFQNPSGGESLIGCKVYRYDCLHGTNLNHVGMELVYKSLQNYGMTINSTEPDGEVVELTRKGYDYLLSKNLIKQLDS